MFSLDYVNKQSPSKPSTTGFNMSPENQIIEQAANREYEQIVLTG